VTGNIDYRAVLADLENKKAQIEAGITGIKAMLALTQNPPRSLLPMPPAHQTNGSLSSLTNAERAARVLRKAGSPSLHLKDIQEGMAAEGKKISDSSLRDVLTRKDKAGRFRNLGKNVFALTSRLKEITPQD
jgi:hypothetical protein